jgi:hypothetical protein
MTNHGDLLQLIEILSTTHCTRRAPSSLCAAWWSLCHFVRSKQSRNGDPRETSRPKSKTLIPAIRKANPPPSTQEGAHLGHLALGGHGGGFTDSKHAVPTNINPLPPSTQEGAHLVRLALGGHGGGGFTDSNSPEVVRAKETSGFKSRQQLPKLGRQTKT